MFLEPVRSVVFQLDAYDVTTSLVLYGWKLWRQGCWLVVTTNQQPSRHNFQSHKKGRTREERSFSYLKDSMIIYMYTLQYGNKSLIFKILNIRN